jgi:hypothetical protein
MMGKKSGSGSGMNNPDHISQSLETLGIKKIRIRDGKKFVSWIRDGKKFGSGIRETSQIRSTV